MSLQSRRLLSLGLTLINGAGIVCTVASAIKETEKKSANKTASKPKNNLDKVIQFAKDYKFTLIFGATSILTGVGSRIVSAKTEASLIATATMLDTGFRKYKNKIKDVLGVKVDNTIRQAVAKDESKTINFHENDQSSNMGLFYIDKIGYFWADKTLFWQKFHMMYRDLEGKTERYDGGEVIKYYTFREFLNLIEARPLKNLSDAELNFGWSYEYLAEEYESCQLEMDVEYGTTDNGIDCCYISFMQEPIWNPSMWESYVYGYMTPNEYFAGANGRVNTKCHLYKRIDS